MHTLFYISSDVTEKFAKKLKALRVSKGLSQEELALLCGIDRTYIGRIERFERIPSLIILQKLADGLGITLIELLKYDE